MHMAFTKYFCGRLEMRYRYSGSLIYNNLIMPTVTYEQRSKVEHLANKIIKLRRNYGNTYSLGQLYSSLPNDLSVVHRQLDCEIDKIYNNGKLFLSDSERVNFLYSKLQDIRSVSP